MADRNVVHRLVELARRHPDKLAVAEPGGAEISFGELDHRTATFAGGLRARGVPAGARLLVLAPMSIPLYVALLGVFRAGCTAVMVASFPADSRCRGGRLRPTSGGRSLR